MSAGGAFGGAKGYQPRPPEKGVFPLDHFGECKQVKEEYMQCLKSNKSQAEPCRKLAKAYLECRMERNLMVKQDLKELGYKAMASAEDETLSTKSAALEPAATPDRASPIEKSASTDKKKQGFIAGLPR
ncbi:probable cytochrome c oxidase assembly protein COX19 [Coccomyxa sp. Obi]|nr:probable cytochrome c oxidase assembly protein COX19 [Coccomyxa sp. Obi]